MREKGKYLFGALAGIAFYCSADVIDAASSGAPYGRIAERNLFGLHDPVVVQAITPPPTLPRVTLSGTTTILGYRLALLRVQSPAKPGEQQREESFMLSEGQREGRIEVLEINEKAGTVRVNNSGTEMTVVFEKDAGKVAGGPTTTPNPSGANPAGGGRGMNAGTSGFQRMIPTRTGRQVPATVQPPLPPSAQTPAPPQGQAAEKPMTPEEQALLKELEQAAQAAPARPQAPQ
jgi:hypothetical protein